MKLCNLTLNSNATDRLAGLAKWHDTTPDIMAKYILEEALREIWKIHGHSIEDMQRGLDYFHKL